MKRLLKFMRLSTTDRKILLKSVALLWMVRLGLWVLPFQKLRELLERRGRRTLTTPVDSNAVEKITRCITLMSRYVPAATCLTQALVTVTMLEESGLPADLRIGVTRKKSGELEAHAWVESGGKVIIGGAHADLTRFTVLHAIEGT
jgi:hypothetical protein